MNVVEINNVTKSFGAHTAVDGLSLKVPKGSIYGFIGPNGSGKTTTLRMIMRIYHPDDGSGSIRVLGEECLSAANDRVGYLPEERGLYKKMRVSDLLRFFAELKGCTDFNDRIDRWLRRLDLADWRNQRVDALSKGMAQKVQFISAVISDPELVVLDEPFSGLDPVNLDVLREIVLDLRANGSTVIFSTHDMTQAERMCDAIFMIYRGRKVLDGTLDEIQSDFGKDTVRVQLDGERVDSLDLEGVEKITDFGRLQELRLTEDSDPQQILERLVQHGRVKHFELAKPSLHDIFVRIARPSAEPDVDQASAPSEG